MEPTSLQPETRWDDQMQSLVVKETEHWIVSVTPMIYNDRVLLTSRDEYPYCYTAGFCYDKGPVALMAAMVWDPETQHQPVGFKKIACDSRPQPQASSQATPESGMMAS